MTLGTTAPSIDYVENGVTLVHPIPFQFLLAGEIVCTRIAANGVATLLISGIDYTVSGGNDLTGTVTKTSGGVAGTVFRIARHTTRAQPAQYNAHDDFPAELTGTALDRLAMVNQEQDANLGDVESRAIRVPPGETTTVLPAAAARKGTILGFNLITGLKELLSYASVSALLATSLTAILPGMIKGDPGANALAIGAFAGASALNIPVGTDLVKTSSYAVGGKGMGAADYIADAAVDAAYVIAHPRAAFVSANGRGFRVSPYQQLDLMMFGGVPDWNGIAGTDSYPAFVAAFDYIYLNSQAGYQNATIYRGGPSLRVRGGQGAYYSTGPIEPLASVTVYGDGGKGNGAASRIQFATGVTGFRSQAHNTSGGSTIDGANHFAGDNCTVQDIAFLGTYASTLTEKEAHGCHAKRPINLVRCTFDGFEGDALYVSSSAGGLPDTGRVENCDFLNSRNGRFATGGDANAWSFVGNSYIANRAWGVRDISFLGSHEFAAHSSGNGIIAGMPSFTMCSYLGNRYSVIDGQEVWAAANAPSGTTADNTGWYYAYPGGAVAAVIPAWSAGLPLRSGGAYSTGGASNSINGCYAESGQGPCQCVSPTLILNGTQAAGVKGTAAFIHSALGQTVVENGTSNGGLLVKGSLLVQVGALSISLDPANENITIDGSGSPAINTKIGGVLKAKLFSNGTDTFLDTGNGNFHVRNIGGVAQVELLGQNIYIAGVKVLTTRQAAIANDASGAANQATVNNILTALRNHGLIA